MLLPLCNCNYQTSLPPISSFPLLPLPKSLLSQPPKSLLLRPSAATSSSSSADTQPLPQSAIKRIADKLRSLGYVEDNHEQSKETQNQLPKHRVDHTIYPRWSSPENPVPEPGLERKKKRGEGRERVPTLAELKMPREELRRLRGIGIELGEELKVGQEGITERIVRGIHQRWRTSEVVRIVWEDMGTHDLLECGKAPRPYCFGTKTVCIIYSHCG